MELTQEQHQEKVDERLTEVFKDTELEDYNFEGFEDYDSLYEDLQQQITEHEVIYYSVAMEYLSEHDNSLQESLALADDMGYEPRNLNSELLATILQQQNLNVELGNIANEIEECFEEDEGES